jgi:hypothetical protein
MEENQFSSSKRASLATDSEYDDVFISNENRDYSLETESNGSNDEYNIKTQNANSSYNTTD